MKVKLATVINDSLPARKKPVLFLSESQKDKLKSVTELLLGVVAAASVATVTVVAPNALQLLPKLSRLRNYSKRKNSNKAITRAFYYLKSQGHIELQPRGKDFLVKITKKGRKKLFIMNINSLEIPRPRLWDGCWWFSLADIPTEDRYFADQFREKMKNMGFFPLQRTVWVYPYDPRNEVDFISAHFHIDKYCTVLRANHVDPEDEVKLKAHFKKIGII